jgi:hypothetical protein
VFDVPASRTQLVTLFVARAMAVYGMPVVRRE